MERNCSVPEALRSRRSCFYRSESFIVETFLNALYLCFEELMNILSSDSINAILVDFRSRSQLHS